jgi:hypothetical protein
MILSHSRGVRARPERSAPIPIIAFRVKKYTRHLTFYPYLEFDEFKKSLGDEADGFSDEELEHVRDVGYKLADAFFEQWLRKRNAHVSDKIPKI